MAPPPSFHEQNSQSARSLRELLDEYQTIMSLKGMIEDIQGTVGLTKNAIEMSGAMSGSEVSQFVRVSVYPGKVH